MNIGISSFNINVWYNFIESAYNNMLKLLIYLIHRILISVLMKNYYINHNYRTNNLFLQLKLFKLE